MTWLTLIFCLVSSLMSSSVCMLTASSWISETIVLTVEARYQRRSSPEIINLKVPVYYQRMIYTRMCMLQISFLMTDGSFHF